MDQVEEKVKQLYDLAKIHPDDENLKIAVSALKSVRRSRGSLQGWNNRYRDEINNLNDEIKIKEQEKYQLIAELDQAKAEVEDIILQKQRMLAEKERAQAVLRAIQTEAELAAIKVKESRNWVGKFHIVWTFMNSVFFDDPPDMGIIDVSPKPDPNKPQMGTSPSDIGKDSG